MTAGHSLSPSRSLMALDLPDFDSCIMRASVNNITHILRSTTSLPPPERARFALYSVGVHMNRRGGCVHDVFSRLAKTQPAVTAAVHSGSSMTYAQLDSGSNRVCFEIQRRGVRRGDRVCLLVQRSLAMLVGIIGILKAGASYIPLDGGVVTDQTLAFVLKDSSAKLLLYNLRFQQRLPPGIDTLPVDDYVAHEDSTPWVDSERPYIESSAAFDEAYVIYTSGLFMIIAWRPYTKLRFARYYRRA